jgi:hypothetical protein
MFNGLWTVEFHSTLNAFGRGILVINGDRVLGGDAGYYYSGYNNNDNEEVIKGKINVARFDQNSISVFGDFDHYSLNFSAKKISDNFFEGYASLDNDSDIRAKLKGIRKESL